MFLAADYPFADIVWTMVIFFMWMAWIWVLVVILTDVFRSDSSGWVKAGWTLLTIILPFLGVLFYLIAHGKDMNERRARDFDTMRGRGGDRYVAPAPTNGAASEIAKAKSLLDAGAIDESEYAALKSRVLH